MMTLGIRRSASLLLPILKYKSQVPVGIDLGTTNSCVAVLEGATPKVVANDEGQRTTPSMVAFTNDGQRLVGLLARRQALLNPGNTIFGAKRLIGRKFNDKVIQKELDMLPYKVAPSKTGDAWVQTKDGDIHSPSAIGGMILGKMKATAEKYLGDTVEDVVITVPAYFNDSQRQATKDAGSIAGLNVVRIINEPTAAALSYGFAIKESQMDDFTNQTIAVYDLGGGTFDISILDIQDGVFEVRATNGNTHLGGEDIDVAIMEHMSKEFKKQSGIDLSEDTMAMQRLKEAAEAAKVELSSKQSTDVHLPYLAAGKSGPVHFNMTFTRSALESLVKPLIDKTIGPVKKCMKDANIDAKKIDKILLVGGMTRMPLVQKTVQQIFGLEPSSSVNPDEAVALGAAIQGAVLKGDIKDVLLLDVTPLSLGIETLGGTFTRLIHRNTTIPVRKGEVFSTCADNQSTVSIRVFQGERGIAAKNKHLGEFELVGIPPNRRGVPQIEVTFNLDANGILSVSAKDLGSGKEQSIRIKASGGLDKSDIEAMIKDAEEFKEQDRLQEAVIEKRNESARLILAVEEQMELLGDKISENDKSKLKAAVEKTKTVKDSDDAEAIEAANKELQEISWEISKSIYTSPKNEEDDEDEDEE